MASIYSELVLALADIENRLEIATADDRTVLQSARLQLQLLLIDDSLSSLSTAVAAVDAATQQLRKAINAPSEQSLLDRLQRLSMTLKAKLTTSTGSVVEQQEPSGSASSADITSEIQRLCIEEWNRFGQQEYGFGGELILQGHQEGEAGYAERIGEYWKVGTNTTGVDGRNHDWFWSATFVSWIFRSAHAGKNFRYSTQHSVFIAQAIRDRLNGTESGFWGFRLNEYRPAVGDIVGWSRQDGIDYDHQNNGDYKGHSDIVIEVGPDRIWVIGGNVGNSVTKRPLRLNASGFLQEATVSGEVLFCVLQNRITAIGVSTGTPPSSYSAQTPSVDVPKQGQAFEAPDGAPVMVEEGYDLLRKWEGCILYAYDDATKPPHRVTPGEHVNGTLTIGYGHTGPDVLPGLIWTGEQAEIELKNDVKLVSDQMVPLITRPLNSRQFSALVSLTFNIGLGAFRDSSALKAVNTGDIGAVPALIARWHKTTINGVLVDSPGLANRRAAEIALWNKA